MFGDDPEYIDLVHKNLKPFGQLVYDDADGTKSAELVKLLEVWRPERKRRMFGGGGAEYMYDEAEDAGLADDHTLSWLASNEILKFINENPVNPKFVQKMFADIWRDSASISRTETAEQEATKLNTAVKIELITSMFGYGGDLKKKMRQYEIQKEIDAGLIGVAGQLFSGNTPMFDPTEPSAIDMYYTALDKACHARGYHGGEIVKGVDIENRDAVLARMVLTFCKSAVLHWTTPESIQKLPVDQRQNVIKCADYVRNSRHDLGLQDLTQNNLPVEFAGNALTTVVNPFPKVQQNLSNADYATLDGDYMGYDGMRPQDANNYYGLDTHMEMANLMDDQAAVAYMINLANNHKRCPKVEHNDGNFYYMSEAMKLFEQIAIKSPDPKVRLEYLKRIQGAYDWCYLRDIPDEQLVLAFDIARGTVPPNTDDFTLDILEKICKKDELIELLRANPTNTRLQKIVFNFPDYGWLDIDEVLPAVDAVMQSRSHAIPAREMRDKVKRLFKNGFNNKKLLNDYMEKLLALSIEEGRIEKQGKQVQVERFINGLKSYENHLIKTQ